MKAVNSQVICWDRGRPARNAPQVRNFCIKSFSRFALIAGGTPAVPANRLKVFTLLALVVSSLFSANQIFSQSRTNKAASPSASSFVLTTEPNAIIWIDEIRRGVTDTAGHIELKTSAGRHTVRVRAMGFKEATVPLVAGRRSMAVKLVRTTDQ